jgi:hypothetical protein
MLLDLKADCTSLEANRDLHETGTAERPCSMYMCQYNITHASKYYIEEADFNY